MARIRADFVSGSVEDGDLAAAGTTLTSVGLANLPEVTGGDDAVIILDPEGQQNGPTVVYVSEHAPGATTATISAPGALHPEGTLWEHGPIAEDFVDDPDNVAPGDHTHGGDYAPVGHDHDDLYHTEAEVDAALADKADAGHAHADYADVGHDHGADYADAGHTHDDLELPPLPRVESIFVPGALAAQTVKRISLADLTQTIERIEVTLGAPPVAADPGNCLQVAVRGASHGEAILLLDGSGDLGARHYVWATETPVIGGAQTDESGNAEGQDDVIAMATKVSVSADLFVRGISFHLGRNLTDPTDPSLDGVLKRAVVLDDPVTQYLATGAYIEEPIDDPSGWLTFPIDFSFEPGTTYWVGCEIISPDYNRVVRFVGAVNPTAPVWTGVLGTYTGDPDSRLFTTGEAAPGAEDLSLLVEAATANDNAMAMRLHSTDVDAAIAVTGTHVDIVLEEVGTVPGDPGSDAQIDVGLLS